MDDLIWLSANETVSAIKEKKLSSFELIKALISRIESVNPVLNAVITLTEESALQEAKLVDERIRNSKSKEKLLGLPILIKDNILTKRIRTTFGSRLYEYFIPEIDTVLVERLKREGAIILGKTNLPEFGLIAVTDNLIFGHTRNPWDYSKTSGGSSGGSAAAVATGMCSVAIGNDAGGSIRIPASFCGVYGFKASFGRIPIYPRFPVCETLFHEGIITRTVADAALLIEVLSGPDDRDKYSLPSSTENYKSMLDSSISEMNLAYSPDLGYVIVDSELEKITRQAAFSFRELGCKVTEINIELPDLLNALEISTITDIITALEEKLDQWKSNCYPLYSAFFEREKRITNRDIARIQIHKEELWHKVSQIFNNFDALLTPASAVTAFTSGENGPFRPDSINGLKTKGMSWLGLNYPFNFTGLPAASIPCGFSNNMPVGLQIIGKRFDERSVLMLSSAFESIRPWQHYYKLIN